MSTKLKSFAYLTMVLLMTTVWMAVLQPTSFVLAEPIDKIEQNESSEMRQALAPIGAANPANGLTTLFGQSSISSLDSITTIEKCGTIEEDETWTPSEDIYLVTCDVTVSNDVTLTIEPGVIAKFDPNSSLFVNGTLRVLGTPPNLLRSPPIATIVQVGIVMGMVRAVEPPKIGEVSTLTPTVMMPTRLLSMPLFATVGMITSGTVGRFAWKMPLPLFVKSPLKTTTSTECKLQRLIGKPTHGTILICFIMSLTS